MTTVEKDWLWAAGLIVIATVFTAPRILGAPYKVTEKLVLLGALVAFLVGLAALVIYR